MANWNRWGVAAGLAGALALAGTARAQTPGTSNNTGTSSQGTAAEPESGAHGTRSGWSGSSATEPSDRRATDTTTSGTQGTTTSDTATSRPSDAASSTGSTASTATPSAGKVDKKLQEDVQKIHAANEAEVHMGQMGQQQATSQEVKDFAQKLEQDHSRLDEKLTSTAQTAGIQLQGKGYDSAQKDAQKSMQKLQGKTGADFDKAFVSMMVKDHEKDIKETQKAAKEARKQNQTELAALLDQAVTGMQGHLQTAKQLEKTLKSGKAARGSSSSSTGSSGSSDASMSGSAGSRATDTATGATDSTSGSTGGKASSHDTGNTGDTTHTQPKSGSGQ